MSDPSGCGESSVWLVHDCEGNTFEQRLTRPEALARLAQLEADETVTNARIEADAGSR